MKYYVSFDCGTQSVKTAIYNELFEVVIETSEQTEINFPKAGWAEMDADKYLYTVKKGIKYCIDNSGIDPHNIMAITGDGIIMGIVGVDENGDAITPYIPYLDSRATKEAEYVKTLDPIWIKESGNSLIEPLQPPIIAMWLLENDKQFKKKGKKFVHNGPYVLSKLAGHKSDDMFIDYATLGGWIIGYKAEEKEWSDRQLELLGIPKENLPKIVKPTDIIGKTTKEVENETGLIEGTPIVAGAGDTMQSLLGCGVYEKGKASDIAGTAAMFTVVVDEINEELSKNSGLYFSIGTLPNTYFYWGYIRTGGFSLQWFKDKVFEGFSDDTFYDNANSEAEKISVGSNGSIFFPYLQGGQGFISNASGCFLNMSSSTGLGEMWRAILESIAYEYRTLTNKMRAAGVNIEEVVITEGGSKSDVWNQIKSDVLDVRVNTMKKKEGATLANAVLAAYAVKEIDNIEESISKVIQKDKTYNTSERNSYMYNKLYDHYMEILNTKMTDVFDSCSELEGLINEEEKI